MEGVALDRFHAGRDRRPAARRVLCVLTAASVALLALPALAAALALPPSETGRYVYDLAHVWKPATIEQAQSEIADIRARTGAEIAVV